jgi:hypothetical protein
MGTDIALRGRAGRKPGFDASTWQRIRLRNRSDCLPNLYAQCDLSATALLKTLAELGERLLA